MERRFTLSRFLQLRMPGRSQTHGRAPRFTRAINSLPQSGGTVIVDDGIWLFDSDQLVSRGHFVLQGSSLNAQLIFTTGSLQIGAEGTDIFDVTISTTTVDQ